MDTLRLGVGLLALVIWIVLYLRAVRDDEYRKATRVNGFVEKAARERLHLAVQGVLIALFLGTQGALALVQALDLPFWVRMMSILALIALVVHGVERLRRR